MLGTPGNLYGPALEELFRECLFLSEWLTECMEPASEPAQRVQRQNTLGKLGVISMFFTESLLKVVLDDVAILLHSYNLAVSEQLLVDVSRDVNFNRN